jgi:polyisoprenyl-phosphate glycosyltransferase
MTTSLGAGATPASVEGVGEADPSDPDRLPHVSVVLPCFDESPHVVVEIQRIARSLEAAGLTYELLVIDDGSTDRTWDLVEAAARARPELRAVRLPRNGGPGTARRLGTHWARGDVVVWTDADMTYPNERIPELVQILDEDPHCDQVVGARTCERGTRPLVRVPAKWVVRKLAERLTGTEIPDLNSGLRAFRREVALPYLPLLPPGFSCVSTMSLAFLTNNEGVRYLPVSYERRAGTSKFRAVRDAYRYLLQVLTVVTYFSPVRVLMPVALALLAVGVAMAGRDVLGGTGAGARSLVVVMAGVVVATQALVADLVVRSRARRRPPGHHPVGAWSSPARRVRTTAGGGRARRRLLPERIPEASAAAPEASLPSH